MIEIISATETRVNGINYGKVADTIANNPGLTSEIQVALELWATQLVVDKQTAESKVANLEAEVQQLRDKLNVTPVSTENWSNLVSLLQQSSVFSRVITLGSQYLDVNMAVTWLMSVVTSVKSLESLQKAVGFLRLALSNRQADLTAEELQFIAQALTDSGIDPAILG
jgi:hypothetical protein